MRLTEAQILDKLQNSSVQYTPLILVSIQKEVRTANGMIADAYIRFQLMDGPSFETLAEITSLASPKNIRMRSVHLLDLIRRTGRSDIIPLLIAPYISPKQAATLAETGTSWLDLSGNMTIRVPGQAYIERTGRPNLFPDTAPIKRVFQGTASLVARALLLEPAGFGSLSRLVNFINSRGASITISTVSKVLNSLEQDLLISKEDSHIRAIDPPKLLDRLAEGYASASRGREPGMRRFFVQNMEQPLQRLCPLLGDTYVFCGFYAAELKGLAAGTQITMYVTDLNRTVQTMETFPSLIQADEEFGQLSVIEARDRIPWFNAGTVNSLRVVDDVELYLEMTIDTPRGPKVANILQSRILQRFLHG